MAKLKCDKHKLRVMTVNGKFIHRTGFGTVCDSPTATIGKATYTAKEITDAQALRPPEKEKKSWLK